VTTSAIIEEEGPLTEVDHHTEGGPLKEEEEASEDGTE
jgi:hypothetical protein